MLAINVDYHQVGWYQSTYLAGSHVSREFLEQASICYLSKVELAKGSPSNIRYLLAAEVHLLPDQEGIEAGRRHDRFQTEFLLHGIVGHG